MKKLFRLGLVAIVATGLVLAGCKKDEDPKEEEPPVDTETGIDQSQLSSDESNHNAELEIMTKDANDAITTAGMGKAGGVAGATVIDTLKLQGKLIIVYNGESADKLRTRTGTITLEILNSDKFKWNNAGAILKITAKDYKVTRKANSKSITFNGTHYITNVLGKSVANGDPTVIYKTRGNAKISFENGTELTWNVARLSTYTKGNGGLYTWKIEGDTNVNEKTKVVVWGTNRQNNDFTTQITTPIIINGYCPLKPASGAKVFTLGGRETTVTFGVTSSGDASPAITSSANCPYGFKVEYITLMGNVRTFIAEY